LNALTLILAGAANGSLYALVALGLVLIYKAQDVVNFAHGEMLMAGAFVGYTVFQTWHLPYPVAIAAAILFGGMLGAVVERVAFRRVAHRHHVTLAMVTVGLSVFIKGLARLPFGSDIYTFPPAIGGPAVSVFGGIIAPQQILTIGISAALTLVLFIFFRYSTLGKQMRATQQSIVGASLVGIDTGRVFASTWGLAGAIGAAAGVLAAPVSLLYPDMGTSFLLKGFAAAVLGGFESITGAIVGAFIVGIVEMVFGGYISTAFEQVSAYIIIIAVLFIKPDGLFGHRAISRV
jgi:branched-chain amino acid transport system permease protein